MLISGKEIKSRLKERKLPNTKAPGYLRRYRAIVSSASLGAVMETRE